MDYQPDDLTQLSPLIPNSEARLFADTVCALVDIIGLQRSCHLLETAEIEGSIRYEIQRVIIPYPAVATYVKQENVTATRIISDLGPFPRGSSTSSTSGGSPPATPLVSEELSMSVS